MKERQTIITEIRNAVAHVWLNRPEVRNALDGVLIGELCETLQQLGHDSGIRIIVLRGIGPVFCAGADLRWMEQAEALTEEENYREAMRLVRCFQMLNECKPVTVAALHGSVLGGALGLAAACDLAIAADTTLFAFSEVRLGLIPATIAPYIFQKTGRARVMEYMLTGRRFSAGEAQSLGLVNRLIPGKEIGQGVEELVTELLYGAPGARQALKNLARQIDREKTDDTASYDTAGLLARIRVSDEAKEGIRAFLEKRQPAWMKS
jgi:methylglutaconyl-CoA hydratase